MGLKFYRIWSTNWWVAPQKETKKLVSFIESIDAKEEKLLKKGKQFTIRENFNFSDNSETLKQSINEEKKKTIVTMNSTVTIKNVQDGRKLTVSFTTDKTKVDLYSANNKIIHNTSPLAKSLLKKTVGEIFKINGIEVYYKVLDIKD